MQHRIDKFDQLRTFGTIREQHRKFLLSGVDLKKSKGFENTFHQSILQFPDEKLIMEASFASWHC